MFLSSHLMSEMAQTAEQLIVIGRGRLIADTSVAEFVRRASSELSVHVRSPEALELDEVLRRERAEVLALGDGLLEVSGLGAQQIGELALAARIVICRADAAADLAGAGLHQSHRRVGRVPRRRDRAARAGEDRGGLVSSTQALPVAARPRRPIFAGGVTRLGVLRSEWTKLWSLRSTRWSLLFAFVAMAGLGPLIAAVTMSRWGHLSAHEHATFDPINTALGGFHLAQLAVGVLGVLVISGEYSTGQIRSTFMAVPRRLPVLWAKATTFAATTFVLTLIASLIAFFVSQAILAQHHVNVSIGHAPALRAVIGTGLYMIVLGVFALALGALVRQHGRRNRDLRRRAVRAAGARARAAVEHVRSDQPLPAIKRRRRRAEQHGRPRRARAVDRLRPVLRLCRGDDRRRGRSARPA